MCVERIGDRGGGGNFWLIKRIFIKTARKLKGKEGACRLGYRDFSKVLF